MVWQLAEDIDNRGIIADATVPALVKSLTNGTELAKYRAACALGELAKLVVNKRVIAKSGAIPVLSDLLRKGKGEMQTAVAETVRMLSGEPNADKAIMEAGITHLLSRY